MSNAVDLADYAEVKERITVFYERYPEGSIATDTVDFVTAGEKHGVLVRARAWRKPDDLLPVSGTGWCPLPGNTPFEKHREVQNAETSAWGRTLEAAGIPRKRSALVTADALSGTGVDTATARQLDLAYRGLAKIVGPDEAAAATGAILAIHDVSRFDDLNMASAIDVLERIEQARITAAEGIPA